MLAKFGSAVRVAAATGLLMGGTAVSCEEVPQTITTDSCCNSPANSNSKSRYPAADGAPRRTLTSRKLPEFQEKKGSAAEAEAFFVDTNLTLIEAIKRGASMEEIAKIHGSNTSSPEDAIRTLELGNARFFMGTSRRPEINAMERRALIVAQTPFAAVIGCADSRVPIEIVFDQGLGDLFVIRVAGNVVDDSVKGSVVYAVKNLDIKVLVVLGHEGCGAVKGAMLDEATRAKEPDELQHLLSGIATALDTQPHIKLIRDYRARDREGVVCNTCHQIKRLLEIKEVRERVAAGTLAVVGGYYEISSGVVDFLSC